MFTNSSEKILAYIAVPNFFGTSHATVLLFLNEHKTKMYLIYLYLHMTIITKGERKTREGERDRNRLS